MKLADIFFPTIFFSFEREQRVNLYRAKMNEKSELL